MLCWEVAAVALPYGDMVPIAVAHQVAFGALVLQPPPWCIPEIALLCTACLQHQPGARPSFEDLRPGLEELVQMLSD